MSEIRNDEEVFKRSTTCGTFLNYEKALDYVGWCVQNDIEQFGRADVYQILCLDSSGQVLETVELDNDVIEPPCKKPTCPAFGCLGCTACKKDSAPEIDTTDFESFEPELDFIISDEDMPF